VPLLTRSMKKIFSSAETPNKLWMITSTESIAYNGMELEA